MKIFKKPIISCPCCKAKLYKVDSSEYKCLDCDLVFDIVQYTVKDWECANSIVVKEDDSPFHQNTLTSF